MTARRIEPAGKQSLYFPQDLLAAIQQEAARLDRSVSWIVQRCIRGALREIRALPAVGEPTAIGEVSSEVVS